MREPEIDVPRRISRARRIARWTTIAVTLGIAQTALVTISPASASVPSFHTSLDPSTVRESMQYLIDTYGVTADEALRRLELQNDAQKLEDLLAADHPESYAGIAMDQKDGGRLIVWTTEPADVAGYIRSMPDRAHVSVRTVAHSLRELESVRKALSDQVNEGPDAVYLTSIDVAGNAVVLWEREWVAQSKLDGTWAEKSHAIGAPLSRTPAEYAKEVATERTAATAAVASARARRSGPAGPATVHRRVLPEPKQSFTPYVDWGYCHPLYCSAGYGGMRGGLRLNIKRDNGTWGGCTSGFNVRSSGGATNGWAWVLTAGHCVNGKTNNTPVNHNGYAILNQHGVAGGYLMERNAYPYDFAVLSYVDGTASTNWLENQSSHNKVMKYCRSGGWDSNADTPCQGPNYTTQTEYITGYRSLANIHAGFVVCATGTGSNPANYPESYDSGAGSGYLVGTRCGVVLSTDVGINTDLCARAGDSGGPLFSQVDHTAYGILEGNQQTRTGACYAGELNNYSPLSKIYEQLDAWRDSGFTGGTTFRVITSAGG